MNRHKQRLCKKVDLFGKKYGITFEEFNDGTLMAWRDGNLSISTTIHRLDNGMIFCPADNVRSAIGKLKAGNTLDFNEEYAIECLMHESVHARATGLHKVFPGSVDEALVEVCTQLYARDRYPKILSAYKVKAVNFERIKTDGLGYNAECLKMRPFFEKDGVLQIGELINVANESESGYKKMMKKLISRGYSKDDANDTIWSMLGSYLWAKS